MCRDIKLENVLLSANGDAKLSDFGLGALPENARQDGLLRTSCGTPACVAPEVLARRGYEGGPADVWSLGEHPCSAGAIALGGLYSSGPRAAHLHAWRLKCLQGKATRTHLPMYGSLVRAQLLCKRP